jgi:hypothetical protein
VLGDSRAAAAWSPVGGGEGAVLLGPVVADRVDLDDPAGDHQLHGVADQGDLDLLAAVGPAGVVAGPAKETVPPGSAIRVTVTPVVAGRGGLAAGARRITGWVPGRCRLGWVATSTPRWEISTSPSSRATWTSSPASHRPAR